VSAGPAVPGDAPEDLYEDAPCGYLSTRLDGTIVRVNRTFEGWTGRRREELLDTRLHRLLPAGARIYYETHVAPLLLMQGAVREIAVEVLRADGSRLPALLNATVRRDAEGRPDGIRLTIFDATDRRRYEQELVRARRREEEVARRLQQSLLAGALPQGEGLEVGVAYRPAVTGLEVGGDWYDAFWLEPGASVALVVGDVVGRGIEAAATMGQLRSAVRALAATGLGPARLLELLDRYARQHDVGRMTTLVYGQVELGTGVLRYACAGHPPPVVAAAGSEPRLLWGGRSLPLDAFAVAGRPRGEADCRLGPGTTLVLYTDGLVERRTRSLSDGMERLVDEVRARADAAPDALARGLVAALEEPGQADDVCALAVRLGGS